MPMTSTNAGVVPISIASRFPNAPSGQSARARRSSTIATLRF
jgi:hypothetical protein